MHATLIQVHVKQQHIDDFINATRVNHGASVREPGNLRFDVLQSAEDPDRFIFYEAYRSAEDAIKHKETDHYLTWRDRVADWMAEPRQGVQYKGLFPAIP